MMDDTSLARHNVIATYPDMERARAAIESLEERGVDAARISLLGPKAEEAQRPERSADRDEAMLDEGAKTAVTGIGAGGAAGGAVGFLAGLAAFGIPGAGPVIAGGIWATTLGGAAAGAGVGLAAGGYSRIKQSEAWELTLASVSGGRVAVGVHTSDEQEARDAAELMRQHDPDPLCFYDEEGRRRPDVGA